ncbi:MAG: DUF3179 domain-containing protein [Candidatus Kerfeldbacteria bacterium]|nr:DUF3179 domain-containing protein [Candidatus Kerfeldbacteria bacterium]
MTVRWIIALVVVAGVVAAMWGPKLWQRRLSIPSNANVTALIPIADIVEGGPGKDGIPSIDHPNFITVAEAEAAGSYQSEGLGISLTIGQTSRFYPFQIVVWHEIVNDTVDGLPVAVTYCPLCGTGLVFDRRVEGQAVEFGVSGKLYQSDLLMYDRRTESLWAQIEGRAVVGPLVGTQLRLIDAPNITWDEFRQRHRDGQVLSTDTGFSRDYQRSPYGDYDTNDQIYFPVNTRDARLQAKTRILGIAIDGQFKAYPVEKVQQAKDVTDEFAGRKLRLTADGEAIVITDLSTDQAVVPVHAFWFAWVTFHPATELY